MQSSSFLRKQCLAKDVVQPAAVVVSSRRTSPSVYRAAPVASTSCCSSHASTSASRSHVVTSAVAERHTAVVERAASGDEKQVVENLVVVGSGPAGYTAAIYAARANLKPVVFTGYAAQGGQLMGTTEVENFPGFPEGVTGPELMEKMRKQAERWGAELHTEDVEFIDLSQRPFVIRSSDREVRAHSMIIATGATAKRLHLPNENKFWGKGISACAICDGASPLFKNREVAVVGGGDSAVEESVYLTKYASHVHLLVRGDKLRASKALQDRAFSNKKITVHFQTGVEDAFGADMLGGLKIYSTATGEKQDLKVAGLFYGIGHQPNNKLISGQVELDEKGYVKVRHGVTTNVEGVFAAGDLHDPEWRQAITAAGSGCMAALSAERYLTSNNLAREVKGRSMDEEASHSRDAASEATPSGGDGAEVLDHGDEHFDLSQDKHRGQFALRKLYHESDRLLAVLYTSPSCGPCRSLKPIFNSVVEEFTGKVHYVEIDIEKDQEIAEAAGVAGTPTLQLFKDRDLVVNLPGVKMKREYRELIGSNV